MLMDKAMILHNAYVHVYQMYP